MIWKRYCGTAAKAGGNRENKLLPVITEDSCLLENTGEQVRSIENETEKGGIGETEKKKESSFSGFPLFQHSNTPLFQLTLPCWPSVPLW